MSSTPLALNSVAPKIPWLTRLRVNTRFRIIQALITAFLFVRGKLGINRQYNPDYIKSYPAYPSLNHRFFIPKNTKSQYTDTANSKDNTNSDETPKYPLYIDIHGGGFALLQPKVDDILNRPFCDNYGIFVVSLDYPKSPGSAFPVAVNALTEIVISVLQDDTLPIDKTRVAIGGGSAGACLALGVVQDERLQGRIHGVQARYPAVDFYNDITPIYEDFRDRGLTLAGRVLPATAVDSVKIAYIKEGQDLKDPRLSPRFADRRLLPPKIITVGCEWDVLCDASEQWMKEMAGGGVSGNKWEKDGLKWICIENEDHGFDHGLGSTDAKVRQQRGDEMRRDIAEWMMREIYARNH